MIAFTSLENCSGDLKCKRKVQLGVNSRETDTSHGSVDSVIYKTHEYSVTDWNIKNDIKIVEDSDMAVPSQDKEKILRNSSETDPLHGSIDAVAYSANEYATEKLSL